MSLENMLSKLAQNLTAWSKAGLNEAQTSQVIVLPILQALGYDIWNPDEIAAQVHSGGGNAAYIPDFTVKLGGDVCSLRLKHSTKISRLMTQCKRLTTRTR